MTEVRAPISSRADRTWPEPRRTRVPFWVYTDHEVFDAEISTIFEGPSWNYVALAAELPRPGCFKTTVIGRRPVVVTRDRSGEIHVFENRCSHRGLALCHAPFGETQMIECPYHRWTYDLAGRLRGIP